MITKISTRKVQPEYSVGELYSLEFANTHLKITHMLIIHLKEDDMIKLMDYDKQLVENMKHDIDDLGNTCAHIALMYDKQNILNALINIMPEFIEIENLRGLSISEYCDRLDRNSKLNLRSRNIVMNSTSISCAYQNTHISQE
jgi:hypothetical protein